MEAGVPSSSPAFGSPWASEESVPFSKSSIGVPV
jgi:hypothetical protein